MCKEKEEAVYLEQKQSRNTHPEKSAGALLSETCTREEIQITYMGALFLGLFFWPIVLLCFISLHLTWPRPFLIHMWIFKPNGFQWGWGWGSLGDWQNLLCVSAPSPPFFDPQGAFLHMCGWGRLFDLKNEKYGFLIFLFQHSSDPLYSCQLSFSLKCWGKTNSNLLHLTNSSCSVQEPIYLLLHTGSSLCLRRSSGNSYPRSSFPSWFPVGSGWWEVTPWDVQGSKESEVSVSQCQLQTMAWILGNTH